MTFSERVKTLYELNENVEIAIGQIGRFQSGENASFGEIAISPSNDYEAAWVEGTYSIDRPFLNSQLQVREFHPVRPLQSGSLVEFTIHVSNGISVYCGSPSSAEYEDPDTLFYPIELITAQSTIPETDATTSHLVKATQPVIFQDFPAFFNTIQRRDINFFTNSSSAYTNAEFDKKASALITLQPGCSAFNDCSGHGACDHCYQKCHCVDGYGSEKDKLTVGHDFDKTCSKRVCPTGMAITQLATSNYNAHSKVVECSNVGVCDRNTGTCKCFPPFTGAACERMKCPTNDESKICSGHGQCLTMAELALRRVIDGPTVEPTHNVPTPMPSARPTMVPVREHFPTESPTVRPTSQPSRSLQPTPGDAVPDVIVYGTSGSYETGFTEFSSINKRVESLTETGQYMNTKGTWDANIMRGCSCDSSWVVGKDRHQFQLGEYFGPDCSQRRCPTGDNPMTSWNEEDCFMKNQEGRGETDGYGRYGNLCRIDCSNQGICDYNTGTCTCFDGFWGENCNTTVRGGANAAVQP